jgi:hypothetical protein
MKAGWIPKGLSQEGQHHFTDLREKGSSGSIIQVYLPHNDTSLMVSLAANYLKL